MQELNRKQAQALKTRNHLIAVARKLFGKQGYADTATDDIVQAAGVTRGALYHQFEDKAALFAAVFEDVARDVLAAIEREAEKSATAIGALKAGSIAFLEAATNPSIRRIYLIDAPSVLGWSHWRAVDAKLGMASLRVGIEAVLTERRIKKGDAQALTHLLSGGLNELALWVSEDKAARARAHALVGQAINALFPE
jgi:AcrR family transcriptional regulator